MRFSTADLCDAFGDAVHAAVPLFRDFGATPTFHGPIATVRVSDDNALVREVLETAGGGRILVVDGGGSTRCALVGGRLAQLALTNGWAGIVVNGCVRDSAEIARLAVGVRALAAVPRKSAKAGAGEKEVAVAFAGVTFTPGHWLYADPDGIVVSARDLLR
jgi:regulator of ribonuclease activity A